MTADGRRAAWCLGAYWSAGALTLALLHTLAGARAGWQTAVLTLVLGTVVPLALVWWTETRVLRVLFALVSAVAVLVWAADATPSFPYGDGEMMARYLDEGVRFPRWLSGMAVAVPLYQHVWQAPWLANALPAGLTGARPFAALLCVVAMAAGTQALLWRFPGRLAVALPLFVPLWVLFSVGYVEYYPLVMPLRLGVLAWAFERPLEERPAWAVGAVAGLLPASYLALAVSAAALVAIASLSRPRRAPVVVGAAALTFVALVWLAYPDGPVAFASDLQHHLNLGDTNTLYGRYVGEAAGPRSIFFRTGYALSAAHLGDVLYMLVWGAGWLLGPLAVAALALTPPDQMRAGMRDPRAWLGAALLAWHVFYVLFMIPKLGPTADIDLFAPSFTLIAFLAGTCLDLAVDDPTRRQAVLAAAMGVCASTTPYLLTFTLPVRT